MKVDTPQTVERRTIHPEILRIGFFSECVSGALLGTIQTARRQELRPVGFPAALGESQRPGTRPFVAPSIFMWQVLLPRSRGKGKP